MITKTPAADRSRGGPGSSQQDATKRRSPHDGPAARRPDESPAQPRLGRRRRA
jgi:hypothetical protein